MNAPIRPRIKICCISSLEEAGLAVRYGASALGLVSSMPSGPGIIPDDLIQEISAAVPPGVATFLLTCLQDADAIVEQQRTLGTNTVQICDRLVTGDYRALRRGMPGVKIVQVVHVTGPDSVDEAIEAASHVDAILLDSGNPALSVKQLGGTGRVHDWSLSLRIRETISIPLFLAGGLTPGNVGQAVRAVCPFGLDVCSGVRTDGALDEDKLVRFMNAAIAGCTTC